MTAAFCPSGKSSDCYAIVGPFRTRSSTKRERMKKLSVTMKKAIIGKKVGMTSMFVGTGVWTPVTVIEAGPNVVVQKKTVDKDGYSAIQVGFGDVKAKKVNKPAKGHFKKANIEPKKYLRELRIEGADGYNVGDTLDASVFAVGDKVDVIGTSKGKGFAGTVKRWNTHRGPMAHGSGYHRGVGSMGANSDPGRVLKGKKLPGHLGNERVTVANLEVIRVDAEKNMIVVKGGVPGVKGGLLMIKNTVKNK